ncbi:hypothetical protein FUAX_09910 [Fulvitalea axinellae]|uniref:Uncharacterized protein n=2 Tax=Fulvitalea axinellae TaxID=1182444 RepID=A0AAU9CQ88_9BACT|nr:hypothetical protein FUAX_09910 [Fulvitalea axinellae]
MSTQKLTTEAKKTGATVLGFLGGSVAMKKITHPVAALAVTAAGIYGAANAASPTVKAMATGAAVAGGFKLVSNVANKVPALNAFVPNLNGLGEGPQVVYDQEGNPYAVDGAAMNGMGEMYIDPETGEVMELSGAQMGEAEYDDEYDEYDGTAGVGTADVDETI